jgi:hypothetical protein
MLPVFVQLNVIYSVPYTLEISDLLQQALKVVWMYSTP